MINALFILAGLLTPNAAAQDLLDTPDTTDTDGDGVIDSLDRCPEQAEDMDGDNDGDGCAQPYGSGQMYLVFSCVDTTGAACSMRWADNSHIQLDEGSAAYPFDVEDLESPIIFSVNGDKWEVVPQEGTVVVNASVMPGNIRVFSPGGDVHPYRPVRVHSSGLLDATFDQVAVCQFADAYHTPDLPDGEWNWTIPNTPGEDPCSTWVDLGQFNRSNAIVTIRWGASHSGVANKDTHIQAMEARSRGLYLESWLKEQGLTKPTYTVEQIGTLSGGRMAVAEVLLVPEQEIPEPEPFVMPDIPPPHPCPEAFDEKHPNGDWDGDGDSDLEDCRAMNPDFVTFELHAMGGLGYSGWSTRVGGGVFFNFSEKGRLRVYADYGLTPLQEWRVDSSATNVDPSVWQHASPFHRGEDYLYVGSAASAGLEWWFTPPSRVLWWNVGLNSQLLRFEAGDGRADSASARVMAGAMLPLGEEKRWILSADAFTGSSWGNLDGNMGESIGGVTSGFWQSAVFGGQAELIFLIGN